MFKNFSKRDEEADENSNVYTLTTEKAAEKQPMDGETEEDRELIKYLELKSRLHDALLDRLNYSIIEKVEPEELRREVGNLVSEVLRQENNPVCSGKFKQIVDDLMDEVLGLGPLEPLLADPSINDILINGHTNVFIERFGVLEKSVTRFRNEKHLLRIIDKIVSRVGRRIDESNPWVDARLEDGSRVNAIIRPCAIDGPSMSIRKFSRTPLKMDRLVDNEALSSQASGFLQGLVEARMNVLISGGTGSGKTTMLNAMSASIDPTTRVVTIEDAAELQLQQEHVVRLETRPPNPSGEGAVQQRELVRNALRMRPDRIIVGEVRGAEAFDMLQAMNTGHDGSMTTVHSNSARDAISRIEQMVSMMGMDMPLSAIRSQIASGLHFIVHLSRLADGKRRVMSISEIVGLEGDVIMLQDIFIFQKKGKTEDGEIIGEFIPTGIRPRCADDLIAAGIDLSNSTFMAKGA
ncbi:Putative conjugal transfer protein/MT3759 [Roseovarius albus]|uniref:Putative conjugal transfer protein/MT3759 n=1 Tax=Roseovarius albus TaxID=1247867 RepID=A0A1X7A8R3_9RHOB|nr:CpaF family protein [Roseovarius albus]SLN73332.1 Putative conjugal transfer protein/MT3759 [Roseovarius albus]